MRSHQQLYPRCHATKMVYSPMTVFSPENAALVAVNSAFPRLVIGRSGKFGEAVMFVVGGYEYRDI